MQLEEEAGKYVITLYGEAAEKIHNALENGMGLRYVRRHDGALEVYDWT